MITWSRLLRKRYAPMIGLDISSSSVKLVELDMDERGEYTLVRAAMEPLEKGAVVDGNIEKLDEVIEAVRKVVRKSGTKAKQVALALPDAAIIAKKIVLPEELREDEIEVQVESEASQYIPFAIDEVALDFCVLGPSSTSPGDQDVLLVASRKNKVEERRMLAEAAGLKPVVLDVDSFAARLAALRLIERLPRGGQDLLIALFEIGANTTWMQVIRNGETIYDREQSFGGFKLTQTIASTYGFSLEEAERKKRLSDLPEDYREQILLPFIENLTDEIARLLQFFERSTPYGRVDYIFLAGGSSIIPGLSEKITAQVGVACMILNPFDGMQTSSYVKEKLLRVQSPSYLTACGLAMRRFLQ